MPPKKKRAKETSSAEMYAALDALKLPDFTPGAVEALRLLHIQFLSRITSELAQLGNDDEQLTIQPKHVDECMEKIGFSDYVAQLGKATESEGKKAASSRSKKKRKTAWSAEMEAEQERLLSQSRQTVQQQQQKQS